MPDGCWAVRSSYGVALIGPLSVLAGDVLGRDRDSRALRGEGTGLWESAPPRQPRRSRPCRMPAEYAGGSRRSALPGAPRPHRGTGRAVIRWRSGTAATTLTGVTSTIERVDPADG